MSFTETSQLTQAMAASGTVIDWSHQALGGPVVDKHSTGGVGDKVSFLLAPIAAACGCYVPMIAGRGLAHGGGTIDKVESIPGYQSMPDFDLFRKTVRDVGCAIIGQTSDLAPADRRLYAIRDVTGTVESVQLITASILSKKIAAGLEGLVMDVKVGNGAFMESQARAVEMATSIIGTAKEAGLKTHALITDMNEVLGLTAGNALEIAECVRFLRNEAREPRLEEVVLSLTAEMLLIGGVETTREAARDRCERVIDNGAAAELFAKMVAAMGGPSDFLERYDTYLPKAPVVQAAFCEGTLASIDTRAVGNAIVELGGGRKTAGQALNLSVGLSDVAPIGSELDKTRPLAVIHAASEADAKRAVENLTRAVTLAECPPPVRPNVVTIMDE